MNTSTTPNNEPGNLTLQSNVSCTSPIHPGTKDSMQQVENVANELRVGINFPRPDVNDGLGRYLDSTIRSVQQRRSVQFGEAMTINDCHGKITQQVEAECDEIVRCICGHSRKK